MSRPATQKMLNYAGLIADCLDIEMPKKTDFDSVHAFIGKWVDEFRLQQDLHATVMESEHGDYGMR